MFIHFSDPDGGSVLLGFMFVAVCFAIYFAPAMTAWNKRCFGSVMAINFFLGWTIVGWVVALAWALKDDTPTKIVVNAPAPAMLCATCGKYSASGSRFCASCGAGL
jgi:hypothetical protein